MVIVKDDEIVVFLDLYIETAKIGRVKIKLFDDLSPSCCENFRQFCTGEYTFEGMPIGYKDTVFFGRTHQYLHGGDFVCGDGTGAFSIHGDTFAPTDVNDDALVSHMEPGLLSMVNHGPAGAETPTLGCQFVLTGRPAGHLDGLGYLAIGRIVEGLQFVERACTATDVTVRVGQCGQM
ncbi:Cyclophilin type peptidyl-prolyl cis-trans isomerase/CLD [Carpediemonas membranifera]|uniref:peptidylprolyl isomerase n=1 Tax=Carpediemonas membranifera TaxID=201153 RepID=A0A8J6AVG8_9EUKA|nr:Cyclophilin type peptidyl-prolyl cis-trans isomerase/CLD [Carpediemonas membranifera]|eukprot:KAG9393530.1 Cyclophilin type peptidyl-prolyl cis-trans isomerase/CLD [Carpediemonas membranifera]